MALNTSLSFVSVGALEVGRTEIFVIDVITNNEISGSEHGSGDGDTRLVGSPAALDTAKLGRQITSFAADGCPGRLYQRCF